MSILSLISSFFLRSHKLANDPSDVYGFQFETLEGGGVIHLSDYKGKVLLVVNTASKCGLTPQYKELQSLYLKYKDQGLVVLGVPSGDFASQEFEGSHEIAQFCERNYGVTFPLTSKQVVSGAHAHPFYLWAYRQLGFGTGPKWNFHKYLINRQGQIVDHFNSMTTPDSPRLLNAVETLLKS